MRACAVTLDIHDGDDPREIMIAHHALRDAGFPATYFVPTSLLREARMRNALRAIDDGLSEVATHGHHHDMQEIAALSAGGSLGFLDHSTREYEQFFGRSPRSFRSPCWCGVGAPAFDRLAALGYQVDSSATPQRLGLFSSAPTKSPWLTTARLPRFVRKGLLEIPTSSFVIPFGTMSLALLRERGALAFAAALELEATFTSSVIVIQLHAADFVSAGQPIIGRRSLRDLVLAPGQGFALRHWLVDANRARMSSRTRAVLGFLRHTGFERLTLCSIRDRIHDDAANRARGPKARASESMDRPSA